MQYSNVNPLAAAVFDSSQPISTGTNGAAEGAANSSELASRALLYLSTSLEEVADRFDLAYVSYEADDRRMSSLGLDAIAGDLPESAQDEVFADLESEYEPLKVEIEEFEGELFDWLVGSS